MRAPLPSLENPFQQRLVLLEDLAASAELMEPVLPLRELASASASLPWWHYGVNTWLGSLVVAAGILPPARLVTAEQRNLTVFLGYGGEQRIRQDATQWTCRDQDCLLFSGEAFTWECSQVSLLIVPLDPERLIETALAMAGLSEPPEPWKQAMAHPHSWGPGSGPIEVALQALLRQEIELAERLVGSQALLDGLQLDDRIYRLMAALLLPEVRAGSPLDRLSQRHRLGRDGFDALIDFIGHNLSEPLTLTRLEEHSHYSRRTLQYAFQERLGCTATQWIRRQRLNRARQLLQRPSPGDTVGTIASQCGYRSFSLFSVEFQQRFHLKPSQLLREARSSLPPDTW